MARGFLPAVVPEEFSEEVDWDELELVRGALVEDKLGMTATDLLWRIGRRGGGHAYVLTLCEHQSGADKWIALRLLRRQVAVWTKILVDDPGPTKSNLPLICCVVVYQGEKPWNTTRCFREIIDLDFGGDDDERRAGLEKLVPDFEFALVEVVQTPEEELPADPLARLGLTLMRAVIEHTVVEWCQTHAWAINLLLRREDADYVFRIVVTCIFHATRDDAEVDAARRAILSAADPDLETKAMNGLEILEKRGEKRGRFLQKIEVVQKMLDLGHSVDTIVESMEFDRAFVQTIANGETPELPDRSDEEPA